MRSAEMGLMRALALRWGLSLNARGRSFIKKEIIMKKLIAGIGVLIMAGVASAVSLSAVGPATVKLTAVNQGLNYDIVGSKTNQSATVTNITVLYKSTVTNTAIDSADFLALLANSFDTTFPDGAQLGMSFGNLRIVDSTGSNTIFDISSVVSTHFDVFTSSGQETVVSTLNSSGQSYSGNNQQNVTADITITYDDTANATTDGLHTQFTFRGVFQMKQSTNIKTTASKTATTIQGSGSGLVDGVESVLMGTISGKATGSVPII
jgi:hypothetical protein